MLRRILGVTACAFCICLFFVEYFAAIWPSFHLAWWYGNIRGYVAHRQLPTRRRKVAIRRRAKQALGRVYLWWAAHIWWWARRALWIKAEFRFPLELVQFRGRLRLYIHFSNHQNTLDALIVLWLAYFVGAQISWIVKEDMGKVPGIRVLVVRLDMAPVKRGGHKPDIRRVRKAAIRAWRDGFAFGTFPEGHRRAKQSGTDLKVPYQHLGRPHIGGLITASPILKGYPLMDVTIDWSATATTMFDVWRLFGSSVIVTVSLVHGFTDLTPDQQKSLINTQLWPAKDALLSAPK